MTSHALLAVLAAAPPLPVLLDRPVAVAGERAVTLSKVVEQQAPVHELVDRALIARDADDAELIADDAEVDRALEEVLRANGLTRPQLDAAIAAQGLTLEGYRARLKEQLVELRWVNLKASPGRMPADAGADWLLAERARLVAGLRERFSVELLDEAPFSVSAPGGDGGCPASVSSWAPSDGGLFGRAIAGVCVLAPAELQEPLAKVLSKRAALPLSRRAVREDVEALVSTGVLHDARVFAVPLDARRVTLLYALEPYPPLTGVAVTGNTARPSAELTRGVEAGDRLGPPRARKLARELEAGYRDVGFAEARVDFRLAPEDGGTRLLLDVHEGPRTTIARLRFTGNRVLRPAELAAALHSRVGGPYSEAIGEKDAEALTHLFSQHGLLAGRAAPPKVKPVRGGVELTYALTEGPVHRVRRLVVNGWPGGQPAEVLGRLESRQGQPFARASVQGDLERIAYQARQQHGVEVEVSPALEIDPKTKSVDLTFDVVVKPRKTIDF